MARLFVANLPHDCSEYEIQQWMESRGFIVEELRIVRDLVAGVSPAFAYVTLSDKDKHAFAQIDLNGKSLRNRTLVVRKVNSGPTLFPAR
jgi:RNA recognition motif-containing protein